MCIDGGGLLTHLFDILIDSRLGRQQGKSSEKRRRMMEEREMEVDKGKGKERA